MNASIQLHYYFILALFAVFLSNINHANSQTVVIPNAQMRLDSLFQVIENQSDKGFIYSEDELNLHQFIELSNKTYELNDLLNKISTTFQVDINLVDNYFIVKVKKQSKAILKQKVQGKLLEFETGNALPGATILLNQKPISTTNINGEFELFVPVGRVNLTFTYVGFKEATTQLLVNTGQQLYLEIKLEASVSNLQVVNITAQRDRAKTQNQMTYSSGRGFTVLEANRYAGTLGDPARMARSFAGVIPARDDRNDIIIRGNSPTGIQWRVDDIEIPNPNHYGGIGLTGNTTTLLNINLLDDSDFLMGAFPTEYGNALAGVFDLKTKKINPNKRQYRLQTGWNGFELGTEGPFSKKYNLGTYWLTYRYSFLDVVDKFGIDYGVLPKFQDLTAKFDFNLSPKTKISVLGIWATSFIELDDHDLDSTEVVGVGEYLTTGSDLSLVGLNVQHRVNEKIFVKGGFSAIHNQINTQIDTFNIKSDASNTVYIDKSGETKYSWFSQLDCRTRQNYFKVGFRWDTYDINYNSLSINKFGVFDTVHKQNSALHLARFYAENEYKISDRFRARFGMHTQFLFLNNSFAVEPRAAIRYFLSKHHVFAFAYGNHHMLQPRTIYFVETQTPTGKSLTNKNLDFSAAHHFNVSYDNALTENMRLKVETYYQHLYQIPIENKLNSTFSLVNVGADFYIPQVDSLVNKGIGRNYGVEVTLERFLEKGYYFMANSSVYKSQYQTLVKKWRSTAFDMLYTVNGLVGYEKWLGQRLALGADLKVTYSGGRPYIPVNETESKVSGQVVFDNNNAYVPRYNNYFRTDLKIYYRINYNKVFTEFAVDFQNLTNHKNVFQSEYNPKLGVYKTYYQMAFFPMFTFRCLF